ncbi:hypothetical protein N8766_00220 [bacterium]|nr:hypothetical protein [bacterium]MDB4745560.1 hypothetical protein [Verrucomicrobiota bacterium]
MSLDGQGGVQKSGGNPFLLEALIDAPRKSANYKRRCIGVRFLVQFVWDSSDGRKLIRGKTV